MNKHRIYIDEVGNADLRSSNNPNHRYLSLTGVIISLEYVENTLFPDIELLKKTFFHSHPDEPVILHRKELVNKREPFTALRKPSVEANFNHQLLKAFAEWEYIAITVTIDKLQHNLQYQVWNYDPYHYCLKVMLERYVQWLKQYHFVGDVMIESRGGKEDMRLKASFEKVWEEGSEFVAANLFQQTLTSKRLKVKPKAYNIAGLQLADLIAHPAFKSALSRHNNESLPVNFGGQISKILEDNKFYRSSNGRIEGWGRKWLP